MINKQLVTRRMAFYQLLALWILNRGSYSVWCYCASYKETYCWKVEICAKSSHKHISTLSFETYNEAEVYLKEAGWL